jgi:hypothetical protein
VAEAARFLASQDDDPSRPLGEPFEHFFPTPFAGPGRRFLLRRRLVTETEVSISRA